MDASASGIAELLGTIEGLVPGPPLGVGHLRVTGGGGLASAFDVDRLALASVAAANLAHGVAEVDVARVVTAFTGHVAVDGEPMPKWADLSGYYRTRDDRFMQFHCNFAHHADGVVRRLGCAPTREAVQDAVLTWDPLELEAALIADGMIAARLRTLEEWHDHPHAAAVRDLPVVTVERLGDAPPRPAGRRLRVLDCSRVLAGPIAGQTLAAHGADVLRVGAAHLPSVDVGVIGTGAGKRNAFVDIDEPAGAATFAALLDDADVWLDAYRPGAFADRGFDLDRLPAGAVAVQLCAFDWAGPWAGRRGFDSIVQSTTGVVHAGTTAADVDGPVPLPVQALDYATGFLAACAARRLVAHQADVGGTWLARLSLVRTRNLLVSLGAPKAFTPAPAVADEGSLERFDTAFGAVTVAGPVGGRFSWGPRPLGADDAAWAAAPD
ncbi:MAG: CoA transferase [Actinomycetota bacterium]